MIPVEHAVDASVDRAPGKVRTGVLIVGSGFSGLGMAITLMAAGRHDFVVLERATDVGGTWRDNTYPGAECDVPSHLYSFSFAPNPAWSHSFSAQPEIQQYLRECADRFGVRGHIRFGQAVEDARWDDSEQRWHVTTSRGVFVADVLVLGVGGLSEPSLPSIAGIDSFAGPVFHTARWRHDHDLAGERVAVIGTGASAVQVVPEIAGVVAHLDVYQRTPPWVVPRVNRAIRRAEQLLYRSVPVTQRAVRGGIYLTREALVLGLAKRPQLMRLVERVARRHLAQQVPDPELRANLTPHYVVGCKRILLSNDYYPVLSRPDVSLVTTPIREIRPGAIVTADGTERPTDTIVLATGFHVTDMPAAHYVRGRDGVLLADAWRDGASAYAGTAVAGFPNLFILAGPNTGLGHTSMVVMIEAQVAYVVDALRAMARHEVDVVEVRAEAQRAYAESLQRGLEGSVWNTGGCASWYLDARGRNTTLWPGFTFTFRRRLRHFDVGAYHVTRRRAGTRPPAYSG